MWSWAPAVRGGGRAFLLRLLGEQEPRPPPPAPLETGSEMDKRRGKPQCPRVPAMAPLTQCQGDSALGTWISRPPVSLAQLSRPCSRLQAWATTPSGAATELDGARLRAPRTSVSSPRARCTHRGGGGPCTATAPARGRADRSHTLHLSPVPRTGASCSLPYPVTHTPHPVVQAVALDPRLPHTSACLPCDPQRVAAVWELLVLQCQHQTSKRLLKCEMTT